MAEQRPYRVPGSAAEARLGQVKCLAVLSFGCALIAINWVTTQHAATVLHDAPWLGAPLFRLPRLGPVYVPWSWVVWWAHWHDALALQPLWTLCTHESLYPTAVVAALATGAIALTRQGWFANSSDLHGSARWATTRDLRGARLIDARSLLPSSLRKIAVGWRLLRPRRRRAGVYLGVWRQFGRRSHIRDCSPSHVLVFAPTRSGKGVGVVVPTLLAWPHSVLVHDLKGENWQLTAGTRKRMGQACLRFEPASPEPGLARFNPLAEVRLRTPHEIRDTHNIVRMILDPYGKGLPDHWERAGGAALTGFILHQLYEGRDPTLASVDALLSDPERTSDQTLEYIMRAEHDPSASRGWRDSRRNPTRTHPVAARAMRSLLNKAEKERSAVISEITEFLAPYRDPVVAANTAVSDFRIVDLMDHARPVSLYIVVALADQEMLTPLIRLMLSQILHRLTERLEYRDGRAIICHRRRLLLMLDEFATLGRLDMFARSLSLIAGYGIKACLITQDLAQIHEAYGQYESITSNCHTRLAFAPNKIETARLLSQMTGESTVRHSHRTVSSSGASVSEPEVARPLLTPDEAMRLGDNEALIFVNGRPAIRANKLRHYAGPFFKLIAKIRAPSISDRLITESEPEPDDEQQRVPIIASEKAVEPATEPSKPATTVARGATKRQRSEPASAQLSFLRFPVEKAKDSQNSARETDAKERLL
jgi:type IV secretion system protein VirD4